MYGMGGFGPPSLDFMNQLNRNKESTIKNKKKIEKKIKNKGQCMSREKQKAPGF